MHTQHLQWRLVKAGWILRLLVVAGALGSHARCAAACLATLPLLQSALQHTAACLSL